MTDLVICSNDMSAKAEGGAGLTFQGPPMSAFRVSSASKSCTLATPARIRAKPMMTAADSIELIPIFL